MSVAPSSPLLRASSVCKHRRSGRIKHVNAPQVKRKANQPLSFTPYIFVVKHLDSDPFGSTCWYHLHCNSGLSTPIAAPKDISDFSAKFSSTAIPAFQLLTSQISEQVLRTWVYYFISSQAIMATQQHNNHPHSTSSQSAGRATTDYAAPIDVSNSQEDVSALTKLQPQENSHLGCYYVLP